MALAKTPKAEQPKEEEKVEAAPAKEMAKFVLARGGYLVQPATKIKIKQGVPTELLDDGWVELQEAAGLLERVK